MKFSPLQGGWQRPLAIATLVSAAITTLSWGLPAKHAATGVGLAFLAATWWLVLRNDVEKVRHFGLSLGGILEPTALSARRLIHDSAYALGWALLLTFVIFPPFFIGYRLYWGVQGAFHFSQPPHFLDEIAGQFLVIALPEEAFFRGYLQTALDDVWPAHWPLLGARIGPSLLVTSALFALGHVLTDPKPARLAVFFPSLVFGWLRAKTGGIGASISFHAFCNLYVLLLVYGWGLAR